MLVDRIIRDKNRFQKVKISYVIAGNIHSKRSTFAEMNLKTVREFFYEKEVIQVSVKAHTISEAIKFTKDNNPNFSEFDFLKNIETIDIVDASVNKLFAIQRLKKTLGISDKNVFTIGDGLNDLQMVAKYQSATFPWVSHSIIEMTNFQVHNVGEFIKQISYNL